MSSNFITEKNRPSARFSASSLPDIVFMLLFFFMVTTVLRTNPLLLEIEEPSATEITKIKKRSLVNHIYVGPSLDTTSSEDQTQIQLDDALATLMDIGQWKKNSIAGQVQEDKQKIITSLHVDKKVEMGMVSDIKIELRKVDALKISYSAHVKD